MFVEEDVRWLEVVMNDGLMCVEHKGRYRDVSGSDGVGERV